jgi:FkbM family methyltransferase
VSDTGRGPFQRRVYATLFEAMSALGRPIGGVRPRRIYHWLARRAFERPHYRWYRDRWGCELYLSPFYDIDRNIIAFGSYEPALHEFLERNVRPGMICLDIGANLGEVALHMALRAGPSGRVLAFEPIPPVRARLERHVARNGLGGVLSVESVALSSGEGRVTMSFATETQRNQGQGSIVRVENEDTLLRVEVATQSLDSLVASRALPRVDLIKIDVQGAEPLVIAGARETLARFAPDLFMEVSPDDLHFSGTDSRALCASVEQLGYSLFELTGRGSLRPIRASDVGPDFSAEVLYCTKRPR